MKGILLTLHPMDLKQLEYFVRVAELGSFTRASIDLNIAQPALSRQVRTLEVELRQNLLLRNGRGVTLTEAGQVLLEHSRGILHQVARAREEIGRVRGALNGQVALGLPPSVAKVITVPLVRAFRQRMPEATLCIREGLSITMQESLIAGRLDIALLHSSTPCPEVETQPLVEEELFLIRRLNDPNTGATTHAIPLTEVARTALIVPSRPNAIRMRIETELARVGLRPLIAYEIDGVSAILDLVADGAGAAILSKNALHTSDKFHQLQCHAITPSLRSLLSLATSAQRPATHTQQQAVTLIREVAAQVLVG